MFCENSLVVKDYLRINIDDKKPQSLVAMLLGLWLLFWGAIVHKCIVNVARE